MRKRVSAAYAAVTPQHVRDVLDYDPVSGLFTWKHRPPITRRDKAFNSNFAGKPAGSLNKSGYMVTSISLRGECHQFYCHILAWAHYYGSWPLKNIDHEDTNRQNNAISNLRDAGQEKNCANTVKRTFKISPFKGIFPNKKGWAARVHVAGTKFNLGTYADPADAARAYDVAATKHFGEFARTNAMLGLL